MPNVIPLRCAFLHLAILASLCSLQDFGPFAKMFVVWLRITNKTRRTFIQSSTIPAINGAGSTGGFCRHPMKPKGEKQISNQCFFLPQPPPHIIFFKRNQNCFSVKLKLFQLYTKANRKQVRAERILARDMRRSAHGFSCEHSQLMGLILLSVMLMQTLPFPFKESRQDTYRAMVYRRTRGARQVFLVVCVF